MKGESGLHVLLTDTRSWLTLLVPSIAADMGWSWLRGGEKGGQQSPFPCEPVNKRPLSEGGGQVSESLHW